MKITFILPAIGKKKDKKYIRTWKMEPLMIAALSGLTDNSIEKEFFDDRIELIPYDTKTDLVMITTETYTAKRAYDIADKFRKRGIPVILGGHHPTLLPDEAINYADSIVIGEAESIWDELIQDAKEKRLKRIYSSDFRHNNKFKWAMPDRSIFKGKKYLPITLIETGRGCQHNCEFCSISSFYKRRFKPRPISEIIQDIEASGQKYFFFVDDNITADLQRAKKLFKELIPLKIFWAGQGCLTMAQDIELLSLMKKSGCMVLLIGFESLNSNNLKQMKKEWLLELGDMNELVKRIHNYGINIYATFVFGFDYDTPDTFKQALDFSLKHDFFFVAFNHLLVWPGTELYERFKNENRIIKDKWWLDSEYKYGDITFIPRDMLPNELREQCRDARQQFFKFSSIFKRGIKVIQRKIPPILASTFFIQNFNLKKEIDRKLNLPVGRGLDELPK